MTSTNAPWPQPAQYLGALCSGALAAFLWWAWMGRLGDVPVYPVWTGVGCVLSLIAVGILAALRLPWLLVAIMMTICFTTAYAFTVVPPDDTGLSGVGVLMVLVGMAIGSTFVCGMTGLLTHGTALRTRR